MIHAYDVIGYTHSDGYCLCSDCENGDTEDYGNESGKVQPIFAGSEWDFAPTCDICQCAIEGVTVIGLDVEVFHRFYYTDEREAKAACQLLRRALEALVDWELSEDTEERSVWIVEATCNRLATDYEQEQAIRLLTPNASVFNENA